MEIEKKDYKKLFLAYKLELIFASLSIFASLLGGYLLVFPLSLPNDSKSTLQIPKQTPKIDSKIVVDIEGAVKNPGAYSVDFGARLKDIVKTAGGLTITADSQLFYKQFNLSEKLVDEQKIYIPTLTDSNQSDSPSSPKPDTDKINVNTASKDELDALPGIGSVTADKIIQNRPYSTPEDLLKQSVLTKAVYEKLKDLITAI